MCSITYTFCRMAFPIRPIQVLPNMENLVTWNYILRQSSTCPAPGQLAEAPGVSCARYRSSKAAMYIMVREWCHVLKIDAVVVLYARAGRFGVGRDPA